MPVPATLAVVILPDVDGLPKDEVINTFVFGAGADDIVTHLKAFYNDTAAGATNPLAYYISSSRNRATDVCKIEEYDITGHLDGSPHGGPYAIESFTLGGPASAICLPSQNAVSAFAVAAPAVGLGSSETVPSDERARDEGAPASYTAISRPQARRRSHIQFGPLVANVSTESTGHVSNLLRNDLGRALNALFVAATFWSVWSRRDAALYPITHGWVDSSVHTVRRRTEPTIGRTLWP